MYTLCPRSRSNPLRQYAGKQPAVEVKAGTIGEALSDLVAKHPDLRRHLYTDDGKLRAFVNVYLNDEMSLSAKEATAVKDSDNISIVPPSREAGVDGRIAEFWDFRIEIQAHIPLLLSLLSIAVFDPSIRKSGNSAT